MGESDTIQKMGEQFMMLLGMCITDWAHIEEELFAICRAVLQTSPERTSIVYFRTPSISARIELVDELIFTVLSDRSAAKDNRDVKEWTKLKRDIQSELSVRNRLAHSPAGPVLMGPIGNWHEYFSAGEKIRYESYAIPSETMRSRTKKKSALSADDLETYLKKLAHLNIRLRDFRHSTLRRYLTQTES